jgi:hypothetical protein
MEQPQYLKGDVFELGLIDLTTRVNTHQHVWRCAPDCGTMTAKPEVDQIRPSPVLFLLALSAFINYLDRGNLSIAAPLLKNEFQLSATQLGFLLSSFFWTYSFFLPLSGWLVDRLDVKWVIAGGFILWSAATAATGAVHAFFMSTCKGPRSGADQFESSRSEALSPTNHRPKAIGVCFAE